MYLLPMKPVKTKNQIREEIAKQIDDFLASGGAVKNIPSGVSGNDTNENLFKYTSDVPPKQSRTLVTDVIKEIDARKKGTPTKPAKTLPPKKFWLPMILENL